MIKGSRDGSEARKTVAGSGACTRIIDPFNSFFFVGAW